MRPCSTPVGSGGTLLTASIASESIRLAASGAKDPACSQASLRTLHLDDDGIDGARREVDSQAAVLCVLEKPRWAIEEGASDASACTMRGCCVRRSSGPSS